MTKAKRPKAPAGLSTGAARFWREITTDYDLGSHELRLLEEVCREMDLIDKMEVQLAEESLIVGGSMGQPVTNPLVSEVRQHRMVLKSLIGAMKLPEEDGASGGGSIVKKDPAAAAKKRWGMAG